MSGVKEFGVLGFFKSFYHIVSLPFSFSLFLECFLALPPDSDHLKLFVSLKRIVLENKKKCCAVGFQEHDGGKHVIFLAWCVRAGKIFFFLVRWLYFCFHPPGAFCWTVETFPLYAWTENSPKGPSLFLPPVRLPWHQARWPQFLLCGRVERGRSWTSAPLANVIRQACRRPSHIQGRLGYSWSTHKRSLEPKWLQNSHNKWRKNQYGSSWTHAKPYVRSWMSGLETVWIQNNSVHE